MVSNEKLRIILLVILLPLTVFLAGSGSFAVPSYQWGNSVFVEKVIAAIRSIGPTNARYAAVKESPSSMLFVGDVLLARNVEYLTDRHGPSYPYKGFHLSGFSVPPYVVGNFEASIPEMHVPTPAMKLNFSVRSDLLPDAKKAGFTHFSLANNHAWDYQSAGFEHTLKSLSEADLVAFGHPREFSTEDVSFVQMDGQVVALIGLHATGDRPSVAVLNEVVAYATKRSALQVVVVHWGEEYVATSNSFQRVLAKDLVEAGVDLVIGHHPHVVQEVDQIDGVPVFYSLGNFIFDQYFSTEVQQGLVVQLSLEHEPKVVLIPVSSLATLSQPQIMGEMERQLFLKQLAKRSAADIKEYVAAGEIPLKIPVASSVKVAMMSSVARLTYLDEIRSNDERTRNVFVNTLNR